MTQTPPAFALPERHLPLPGTSNFRDLGGYIGHAGRPVRWRRLFRSDHLADLTPLALQELQTLGVARAVDFRGEQERRHKGYAWPQLERHVLSVEPTVVQQAMELMQAGERLGPQDAVELMQATYRSFVRENAAQFAQLFQLLLEGDSPLVFHCTAGKDRTGWAANLLLQALGVSSQTIEEDYLLTNRFYQRPAGLAERAGGRVPAEVLEVLWKVQPPFLHSALEMVERDWGGMPAYLRESMGLDAAALAELRGRYLQPAG